MTKIREILSIERRTVVLRYCNAKLMNFVYIEGVICKKIKLILIDLSD